MENLVSIVVPAYNAERYLEECIESVLAQDHANWELILVDDGSLDNTYRICTEYAGKDSRIRVFHNDNHGVSYSRNFGIDMAQGDYLCFIDADDKILPDYLSQLLNQITENRGDIVFCGYRLLFGDKYIKKSPRIKEGVYQFSGLSYRAIDDGTLSGILFGSVCGALYRRKLIKDNALRFDSSVRRNEDGLFNLELLPHAQRIAVTSYEGYIYRQWKSVNTTDRDSTLTDELHAVTDIISERCHFYDDLTQQLKRRTMSIVFWHTQRIANSDFSAVKLIDQLRSYLAGIDVSDLYKSLDLASLNRYKKLLINLIYKKRYLLFIVLIRYIKHFLEKRLKH